jgi:hypothetical protein
MIETHSVIIESKIGVANTTAGNLNNNFSGRRGKRIKLHF